jgi:5-formyltetrahydrofolate cyclo-ligase
VKAELRRELDGRRRELSPAVWRSAAALAQEALIGTAWFKAAGTIMLYQPIGAEMPVDRLVVAALGAGKRLALPRCEKRGVMHARLWDGSPASLERRTFGILEPLATAPVVAPQELDLVVVPGVGFDRQGYRLGWGGGFYDRYLPPVRGAKVGIAFGVQIVERLPHEEHDARLDGVVTEAGVLGPFGDLLL